MTPAKFRELVAESRQLRGLPRYVEDEVALDLLAAILLEGEEVQAA